MSVYFRVVLGQKCERKKERVPPILFLILFTHLTARHLDCGLYQPKHSCCNHHGFHRLRSRFNCSNVFPGLGGVGSAHWYHIPISSRGLGQRKSDHHDQQDVYHCRATARHDIASEQCSCRSSPVCAVDLCGTTWVLSACSVGLFERQRRAAHAFCSNQH